MPVTKSAKKKLKQDVKRHQFNKIFREKVLKSIKDFRKKPSEVKLKDTYSLIDRAWKKNVFHKNKAARIKSALSKLVKPSKKTLQPKNTPKKKN